MQDKLNNIPQDEGTRPRRVVCAALKLAGGQIVVGARHYDCTIHEQLARCKAVGQETKMDTLQGFIDQWGVFMSRTEAWTVALDAGQIIRRCGGDTSDGGTLYSENLY